MYMAISIIQDNHVSMFIDIVVDFEPSMMWFFRVSWINEWFTLDDMVLTNLDRTYALEFFLLGYDLVETI